MGCYENILNAAVIQFGGLNFRIDYKNKVTK